MTELKPCPFCGGTDLRVAGDCGTGSVDMYSVTCNGCGSSVGCEDLPTEAEILWNTRHESAKAAEQPDEECKEDDGCPTEKAVLQRFWRQHQQVAHQPVDRAFRNAEINDKSVLEMLEMNIVDYPTPHNIEMQRLYLAALKEPKRESTQPDESTYQQQVRLAQEDMALLGGLFPHEQIAHARKREARIAELETALKSSCDEYRSDHYGKCPASPVRESVDDAAKLAEALNALSCEAEGHAVVCQSGELMNACAKANKVWTAYHDRRRGSE